MTSDLRKAIQEHGIYVCAPGEAIPGRDGMKEWHNVFRLRRITQDGRLIPLIRDALSELMQADGLDPSEVQFAGMETGAIPLITALALWHRTTGFVVRKEARDHGTRHQFEGPITDKLVVLVDDLVSGGARVWQCVDAIGIRASHLTVHRAVYTLVQNGEASELPRGRTTLPVRAVFQRKDFDFTWVPERTESYSDMLR